jgi:hypothetical protein
MNIFVIDRMPSVAARYLCDKHVPKMTTESAQMMASALIRHGSDDLPNTKAGTPYLGGYPNHPCTKWAGDGRDNFMWLAFHAIELCRQYKLRYDKIHACTHPIIQMVNQAEIIPEGKTPHVLAMPDKYKEDCPVKSYRKYYVYEKKFATWNKGTPTPLWWITQNQIKNEHITRQAQAIEA